MEEAQPKQYPNKVITIRTVVKAEFIQSSFISFFFQ